MKIIMRPGQRGVVVRALNIENLGIVVRVQRLISLDEYPYITRRLLNQPLWLVDRPLLWSGIRLGRTIALPVVPDKCLAPLPDEDAVREYDEGTNPQPAELSPARDQSSRGARVLAAASLALLAACTDVAVQPHHVQQATAVCAPFGGLKVMRVEKFNAEFDTVKARCVDNVAIVTRARRIEP